MEEPLEGEETSHRDGEDKLAERVHGHPTPLWDDGEKEHKGTKRKVERLAMMCFITTFCKQKTKQKTITQNSVNISNYVSLYGIRWVSIDIKKVQFVNYGQNLKVN